tara:strand:- start:173153 stop:173752 length:600 start_codon:yes stop_codon:yes gene_type:complete
MANIKCGSCGAIWNVNNPAASSAATQASSRKPQRSTLKNSSSDSANSHMKVLAISIGGLLVLLALVGIGIAMFVSGSPEPVAEPIAQPQPPTVAAAPKPVPVQTAPTFREVDLPESTRQAIYLDYRKLVESSTEKKVMIMKESPVNKSLQNMLGKTVDREIVHFALIHKISEDDVLQIIAEGDAKQWPGSRAPEQETNP